MQVLFGLVMQSHRGGGGGGGVLHDKPKEHLCNTAERAFISVVTCSCSSSTLLCL